MTGYGHIGDGNIHLNVVCASKETYKECEQMIEKFVLEYVTNNRGSISAEHGVGFQKAKYLDMQKGKEVADKMRDMKDMFDPNGILNPYKLFE